MKIVELIRQSGDPGSWKADALYFIRGVDGAINKIVEVEADGTPHEYGNGVGSGEVTLSSMNAAISAAINTLQSQLMGGSVGAAYDTLRELQFLIQDLQAHATNVSNPHSVTKAQVGLGNCDNTSDVDKPVSTLQALADAAVQAFAIARGNHTGTQAISTIVNLQSTLDGKQAVLGFTPENTANKGAANGYPTLDGTGRVPAGQLPAYVDDVIEYANIASFPATGATGIIYIDISTDKEYRWTGSAYREISPSPGSTDAVAEGSVNLYFTNSRALTAAPAETATTVGALITGAAAKTTPVDADQIGLVDSAASNVIKKLTWANAKATLKTYFDSVYQAAGSYLTGSATANLTAGYTSTEADDGTISSGTLVPTPTTGNMRKVINGGAFTLAPPSVSGSYTIVLDIINGASAGAITTGAYTKVTGDAFDTTNAHSWRCFISKGAAGTHLHTQAMF